MAASGPNYSKRRSALVRSFKAAGIDALLVSAEANVRYLTGFTGDSTWLYVSRTETILLSDTRYETQISNECEGLEASIRTARQSMSGFVADLVGKARPARLGFESSHLTFAQHASLAEAIEKTEFVPVDGLTERLREVKDKWELRQIREAVQLAERGIAVVRSTLRHDQTELEVRYVLEAGMRDFGASGTAFEPIVGAGPTGALPHAHAGDRLIGDSPVLLVDWGAETRTGYRSDITRVFVTGKVTRQMRTVYDTVLKAQKKAIAAIRPGKKCSDIDRIARKIITDAGFGQYFGHGLGHGFGLEIHESPRVSPLSDQILEPGMVVTVEPGIYLADRFGVRIEDDILVTSEGHEVLTSVPREFDDAVVEFLA